MTKYFQVEDGVVVQGPRDLPKSHKNISGFHHLDGDLATLKGHGWLPEEVIGYEPFDQTTQVREGPVFEVTATEVESVYTIRDKTKDELTEDVRNQRLNEYATVRDQLDAIMKQMNQDRLGGKELTPQTDDWVNDCLAVKTANPKPE